jgi:ankyrin repeat protein
MEYFLFNLITENDVERFQAAIKGDPDLTQVNAEGLTLLMFAIAHHKDEFISIILKAKPDSTATNRKQQTAGHYLAGLGNPTFIQDLLEINLI